MQPMDDVSVKLISQPSSRVGIRGVLLTHLVMIQDPSDMQRFDVLRQPPHKFLCAVRLRYLIHHMNQSGLVNDYWRY